MKEFTREEAESRVGDGYSGEFNEDILDAYDTYSSMDPTEAKDTKIIEATAKELADMKVKFSTGDDHERSWEWVAKMFPDVKVHTCITHDLTAVGFRSPGPICSSCQILVDSTEQAICIEALICHELAGGYMRGEIDEDMYAGGPVWVFFEEE